MDFASVKRKKTYEIITKYIKKEQEKDVYVRSLFKLGKKLGEGVQGVVYKAKPKKSKNLEEIVIKRSNMDEDEYKYKDKMYSKRALKLQPYIELACLTLVNQLVLQRICPNFTLNYYNEILNTCTKDPKISNRRHCTLQYNEFVNYGTFEDWASKTHDEDQWYNAIFQILVGLYAMYKYYNLFHNDFHGYNLLVHKVKPGGYWVYIVDGVKYYVPNLGFVFLISDFGYGWIPNIMYPGWYIKKRNKQYNLANGGRLTSKTRIHWDIKSLKKGTIDPILKVSKVPKYFKEQFIGILDEFISSDEDVTLGDLIHLLYGSTIVSKKECNDYPNYCYNIKRFVSGSRIETYNLDKKLNLKKLPSELASFFK